MDNLTRQVIVSCSSSYRLSDVIRLIHIMYHFYIICSGCTIFLVLLMSPLDKAVTPYKSSQMILKALKIVSRLRVKYVTPFIQSGVKHWNKVWGHVSDLAGIKPFIIFGAGCEFSGLTVCVMVYVMACLGIFFLCSRLCNYWFYNTREFPAADLWVSLQRGKTFNRKLKRSPSISEFGADEGFIIRCCTLIWKW